MKLLLDTHVLLWAMDNPTQLSAKALTALQDAGNELVVSAATVWELAIKIGQGKLALGLPYRRWMETAVADLGLEILPITIAYADGQARLPHHHRDPFDRLIIAQALADALPVVCSDTAFDAYGIARVW